MAASCGDGAVEGTEACDDGNNDDGDGCAKDCTLEGGFACTGAPSVCVTTCGDGITAGAEGCDDSNTTDADGCDASCAIEPGYSCAGQPSVCTPGCGDGLIVGAEACDDGNTADADGCSAACAVEAGWTCDMAPSMCAVIHGDGLIVGAEACDDGNMTDGDGCSTTSTIESGWTCTGAPSACVTTCGDGIPAGVEACDDGDTADDDGCSAACTVEKGFTCDAGAPSICVTTCGDGIIGGAEACDDMNTADADGCSATCAAVEPGFTCTGEASACVTTCGDGIIAGLETCDDKNTAPTDGCDATCHIESGWYCTGATSTCTTLCGDGIPAGAEACDDKNMVVGDGCTATCGLEAGWTCSGAPSVCATTCGDGVRAGVETCDDGNAIAGDGCSAACAPEPGWTCTGVGPTSCTTTCGDTITAGAETCDDGGTTAGDGCDAACKVEPGYGCSGAPSVCGAVCGDGLKIAAEKCDDGNVTNGDCCSSTCQVEAGCEIEPNDTKATANDFAAISVGAKVKGFVLPAATDKDTYLVVVPTGSLGTITAKTLDGPLGTTCLSKNVDSLLSLFDSASTTALAINDDNSSTDYCSTITASGLAPGNYYVEVKKSTFATAVINDYTLQITVALAICGNGILETGEACDDSNVANGDGCSSVCKLEPKPEVEPNNTCATASGPFALPPNQLLSGSISPANDQDWFAFTVPNFADVQFETFDSNGPGTCTSTTVDTVIQLFNASCFALGLSVDQGGINNCSRIDPAINTYAQHLAPGTYYLKVTPFSATGTFSYRLLATLKSLCGNGLVEGSEECDGTPGCQSDCTVLREHNCNDGVDNDGDGAIDLADSDCAFGTKLTTPCAAGQSLLVYDAHDLPQGIPDEDFTGIFSKVLVSGGGSVARVVMGVNITHAYDGDVYIYLSSPNGTEADVSLGHGSSGQNYTNTIFDTTCTPTIGSGMAPYTGCFKPDEAFSVFAGQPVAGAWQINVLDIASPDAGTLTSFSLAICAGP